VSHIDHFTASALSLAYEKNISIEEAMEALYQETLKLHNEFLNSHPNPLQIEENHTTR
jgi:hypothetical protein